MMLNTALKKLKMASIVVIVILLLIVFRLVIRYDVFYELSHLSYEMSGGTVLAIVCIAVTIVLGFFSLLISVIVKNNV